MTTYREINVTHDGFVSIVELARPPLNFFNAVMIDELADAFANLDERHDCRAIVLAAQGKAFCAGADFSGQDADAGNGDFSDAGFRTTTAPLYQGAARLFANRKPVVGTVQGAAVGGGLGLALVPDFRIASPAARFSANFVKLGIHQGFGISVTLPRLIGQQAAHAMLLSGRRLNGEQAAAIGLVDLLVEADQLRAQAVALALEIAENAPLAVMSVRATMREGLAASVRRATDHELNEQEWLRQTDDAAEGIAAVAERRPGRFTGT
ncbi:MAG: enoyl-CoA hydratase/isomerase family protein [Pseudomonadota bacterium]